MSQASYTIAGGTGAAVRTAINAAMGAIKSNNSDPAASPSSPVQGQTYAKLLSATCQEVWEYDGASWVLRHIIDPTAHKFYPANVRAISGLTLSNNVSDATNDIDIAAGWTAADSDGCPLILTAALTKRLDAAWAVGNNQGGLDTGSIGNNTYFIWLIRRPDTGVVDVLFSLSASSPTMPANYTQKRRIGAIMRASAAIRAFKQVGDTFYHNNASTQGLVDVNATTTGTSAVTRTLTVPIGIVVEAILNMSVFNGSAGLCETAASPLELADIAPSGSAQLMYLYTGAGASLSISGRLRTNASGQIRTRATASAGTITQVVGTVGWVDRRGQDD